jgi:large subunit ribosomal protein L3
MVQGMIGRKRGMTQVFGEQGIAESVTVIEAGPCYVTQVRTTERDGYEAVQLGFEESKKLNKPELGHLKDNPPVQHLREFRVKDPAAVQVGQKVDASLFKAGDTVDITGISKGRGFAGVVKRHGFRGGPKTHGQSDRHRAPGSVGSTTTPGRVLKGLRMAGRMGSQRVTVQNVAVLQVDPDRNLLVVRGGVPGPNNGLIIIRVARKTL